MWIQSPEYDSIDISGASSCQSHTSRLSAEGREARGHSTQRRTSRDSSVQIKLLLLPYGRTQQGRVWDPFYSH